MISIAIVDDHKIFIDGVKSILEDLEDIKCEFTATNKLELFQALANHTPSVILMDIGLGNENGIEITEEVLLKYPNINIIALSMHQEENYIIKMMEAGAKGYLLKDAGSEEMLKAIRTVHIGQKHFNEHVSTTLLNYVTRGIKKENKSPELILTKREIEILRLVCMEYSNQEIATELYISIRTVDTHKRNLLEKLDAKNTVGLVKYAIKHGIID